MPSLTGLAVHTTTTTTSTAAAAVTTAAPPVMGTSTVVATTATTPTAVEEEDEDAQRAPPSPLDPLLENVAVTAVAAPAGTGPPPQQQLQQRPSPSLDSRLLEEGTAEHHRIHQAGGAARGQQQQHQRQGSQHHHHHDGAHQGMYVCVCAYVCIRVKTGGARPCHMQNTTNTPPNHRAVHQAGPGGLRLLLRARLQGGALRLRHLRRLLPCHHRGACMCVDEMGGWEGATPHGIELFNFTHIYLCIGAGRHAGAPERLQEGPPRAPALHRPRRRLLPPDARRHHPLPRPAAAGAAVCVSEERLGGGMEGEEET